MTERWDSTEIHCRAKVSRDCENGNRAWYDLTDDGTYDDATGTIVCDECYNVLMPFTPSGRGLLDELNDAIGKFRSSVL